MENYKGHPDVPGYDQIFTHPRRVLDREEYLIHEPFDFSLIPKMIIVTFVYGGFAFGFGAILYMVPWCFYKGLC